MENFNSDAIHTETKTKVIFCYGIRNDMVAKVNSNSFAYLLAVKSESFRFNVNARKSPMLGFTALPLNGV